LKPGDAGGSLTVLDYLRPVWRFRWIVLIVVVLAAAATYFVTNRETKVYQTSTDLYIGQSDLQQLLDETSAPTDTTDANQALLVTTPAVAAAVQKTLKLPYSPQALLGAVSASSNSNTNFLTVTAQGTNPQLAAKLANAFAQAYLQQRQADVVASARIAVKTAQAQLQATPRTSANTGVVAALQQQIDTLEGVVVSPPFLGNVVTKASVPVVAVSPTPKRDAIFAAVLALALAIIVSYLFDRGDRRVRQFDDLEALYDLPVLASIPHVPGSSAKPDSRLRVPPPIREAHRALRVNVELAREERDAKVIMITSALPSEGKSTVVRNLAMAYSEAGARVAVIEADLRRPVLAAQFGIDTGPGVAEALTAGGELRMQAVPHRTEDHGRAAGEIRVAVAGASVDDPTVLLTEGNLRGIMRPLAGDYDIVLIDSPPLLAVSDGLLLLGLADGVVLVVRAGATTYHAASRMQRTFDRVSRIHPLRLLGTVINDIGGE
jgi:polysaccharide biosynthesis transport protein